MANSTITLDKIANYIRTFPEIAIIVQTAVGGVSLEPMLTIATDVMTDIIAAKFNWKFNRFLFPVMYTNSWQQDYATNVVNLGWLESGVLVDINNTALPKPQWPLEVVQQLPTTSTQYGMPGQVCWLPNDQLVYGTWGATTGAGSGGNFGNNPQPNQVITNGLGQTAQPINPITQVVDYFGNFWVISTYGTTGATNPFLTNQNPKNLYPTQQNPLQAPATVTDGSVVWSAINPKAFGVRLNPVPPQNGTVFQIYLVGQLRALYFQNGQFTKLNQTIEPVPDDWARYFRAGCIAYAYEHSPNAAIRAKAMDMKADWMRSLVQMSQEADRERTNFGFYPATAIIQQQGGVYPGPAYPYQLPAA